MCGFVAVLSQDPAFQRATLDDMRDRLSHRGPDGKGSWLGATQAHGLVGLGHRRLSIIDLSAAADQPFFGSGGNAVIVYNGEIYNFVELRRELIGEGVTFSTGSDTEVLLKSYEVWGEACLSKLNGMFAFAIWDRRKQQLFVARDRFGEKPLYLTRLPCGGVAFASEAKALFAHPGVPAELDFGQIDRFVAGGALIAGQQTLFANVMRFPSGTAAIFDALGGEVRRWRYWTPDYTQIRTGTSMDGAAEEFADRLKTSLRQRIRSDVGFGACLSGGLDSSTLVGFLAGMQSETGDALRYTYSARFDDDPTISEGTYIDQVLGMTGLKGHAVSPNASEFEAEAEQLYWHQEIPFLSPSIYLEWRVLKLARETGTTVMIDGQGADELLGGYQHYFNFRQMDLMNSGRLVRLARETMAFDARLGEASKLYADSERRFSSKSSLGVSGLLRQARSHALGTLRNLPAQRSFKTFFKDGRPGVPTQGGWFRFMLARALLYDMLPNQLHSADRSAMAFGVETRFPFLDHALVDWVIGLPTEILTSDGWLKMVLRHAAEGAIPKAIQWRADKVGFAAPQDTWLRGALRNWMEVRLFDRGLDRLSTYDRPSVEATWREHLAGADRSWELFRWASAAEWLSIADRGDWKRPRHAKPDRARESLIVDPLQPVS